MGGLYNEVGISYDEDGAVYNALEADSSYIERPGRFSLSPNPFDTVRSLETFNRLTLKLPGGHTRYVSANIGACSIIPVIGLYKAELSLTDTIPPEIYPW